MKETKTITLISKISLFYGNRPIGFAKNEHEAKKKLMELTEKHPERYDNDAEKWWDEEYVEYHFLLQDISSDIKDIF